MPDGPTLRLLRRLSRTTGGNSRRSPGGGTSGAGSGSCRERAWSAPPAGYPADHPAIDLLRRKQLHVTRTEPPALAEGPKLLPRLLTLFTAMLPLVRFLNQPLQADPMTAMDREFAEGPR